MTEAHKPALPQMKADARSDCGERFERFDSAWQSLEARIGFHLR
jgi:hypothetical protein